METQVTFIHVSDTHLGADKNFTYRTVNAYAQAHRLVDVINNLPIAPDFVVHTGDLANHPDPSAYQQAREIFEKLKYPAYYLTGNHDTSRLIREYMTFGPCEFASESHEVLGYAFSIKGCRFVAVDARGPDEIGPHGLLSDEQLEFLERETKPDGPPLVVFTHFCLFPMNSPWLDAHMRILNADKMHALLSRARNRLRGVFHGHIHRGMQMVKDSVVYTAVPSTVAQLTAWPTDREVGWDDHQPPAFNVISIFPDRTMIQQHTFPKA